MLRIVILGIMSIIAAITASASSVKPETDAEWNTFLTAIAQVESSGRDAIVVRDTNGRLSYGCLQIQALYLADSGLGYGISEMTERAKAFAVAKAYMTRYGRSYERRTGKTATYEVLARIHNGGPRGAERTATEKYWAKVKAKLEK